MRSTAGARWQPGRIIAVAGLALLASIEIRAASGEDWELTKIQLDHACEAARADKLQAELPAFIDECIEKQQRPDRASCERFYADYGANPPLYYDLPECVTAFDHRQSQRSRDARRVRPD